MFLIVIVLISGSKAEDAEQKAKLDNEMIEKRNTTVLNNIFFIKQKRK